MSARCRILLLVVLGSLLVTGSTLAHQDRIIELEGRKLVGLPSRYEPAEFDRRTFRITIGNRTKQFSPFLQGLFRQPHDLEFTASWYHDASGLPPYLSLRILPKGKDYSYQILIDLDALRLIKLEIAIRESETSGRYLPIAVSDSDLSHARPK